MIRRHPRSPLFPCPTLFRSRERTGVLTRWQRQTLSWQIRLRLIEVAEQQQSIRSIADIRLIQKSVDLGGPRIIRSEEHTSELQSHFNLVCRLLLLKKTSTSH